MKKKLLMVLLCGAMVCSLAACGSKDDVTENTESTEDVELVTGTESEAEATYSFEALDPALYVTTLADYTAIPVSLTGDYAITDEAVNEVLLTLLDNMGLSTAEVTDRTTVEAGDLVNADYTGYQDGEAFEGGSATDQLLDVDNNCVYGGNGFIDGFTLGLIGGEVGSTVSSQVTFPEDYGVDTLNGQEVTFEFDINGIYAPITADDLTDEMVAENFTEDFGVSTKQELLDYIRQYLEDSAVSELVQTYMLENSVVEVPEEYLEQQLQAYEDTYAANYGGMDNLEYYLSLSGTTLEEVEKQWRAGLEESIKLELIFRQIASEEGMQIDEEGFDRYIDNFLSDSSYGFESEEDVYNYFGYSDAEYGKVYLQNMYIASGAMEYAISNAVITEE